MINILDHFWPFFANILYFWPRHIKVRTNNINPPATKNSGSLFFASKLHFSFCMFHFSFSYIFPNFCRHPDLRNSVWMRPDFIWFDMIVKLRPDSERSTRLWTFDRIMKVFLSDYERSTGLWFFSRIMNVRPHYKRCHVIQISLICCPSFLNFVAHAASSVN